MINDYILFSSEGWYCRLNGFNVLGKLRFGRTYLWDFQGFGIWEPIL